MDEKNVTGKIFYGLVDEYKELVYVIQTHDTPITFDELHEALKYYMHIFIIQLRR